MKRQHAHHLIRSSWAPLLLLLALKMIGVPPAEAGFVPVYRGGICVADAAGNCVGGDIRAESGLGPQVGYMKDTADAGTVAVYRSTCYSDISGNCTAWGLSLDANGSPAGYLSTSAPDAQSANSPLVQSNGLLLQNLGGAPSAFLWTIIPPNIANLSPATGAVGSSVTITGSNFGSTQGASTVTFNGTAASPTSWSDTSITVPVPLGATTGLVVVTVAGVASNGLNFTLSGGGGINPSKLVVTSVNGGNSPSAGIAFAVIVQAQDGGGVARNVTADTGITLSLKTGTGTLGGTLTGSITAGTNQVTLSAVTYTKAEIGIVLTASRTSGDTLTAGDSASFSVNPGSATALVFTTQPGNTTAGNSISGPPTVVVQDAFGNTVTSSTASITVTIGTNPGGGTLSGTTTVSASSGVAAFTGLSINQAGTGYTLMASSTGLTGTTSNAFDITSPSGLGIISGFVTRVSDGTGVSGALIEVFQGAALIATGSTSTSGAYSVGGLSDGIYAVRASSAGYVPRVREGVTIANAAPVTVNLTLNVGIAIYSPLAGSLISDYSVLVTGEFDTSLAPEVGINVNGVPAKINMETFSAVVAVAPQTTTLTATVTAVNGTTLASESIPITVQSSEPPLTLQARPAEGIAPLTVSFDLTTLVSVSQLSLDANGDGTVDFQGSTLDLAAQSFIFQQPGLYYPSVTVTDGNGATHSAVALIQVYDATSFDSLFQQKWQGFKNALRAGDTASALLYIAQDERAQYQGIFQNITVPVSSIDQVLTNIQFVQSSGDTVEYEMLRTDSRGQLSYLVRFVLDRDGIWRIQDL